jgi:hypothetical protein
MQTLHFFNSTSQAYNATQCSDEIKTGDVLAILSEQVIGLAYTWPIAITTRYGELHTVNEWTNISALKEDNGEPVFTNDQVQNARDIAKFYNCQ